MERRNLIRELERVQLPETEIKSHKKYLRSALLNSDYFEKDNFFDSFKKYLIFIVPTAAAVTVFGFVFLLPKFNEARALAIAKDNPDVQKMIFQDGMVLSDFKLRGNSAYLLLDPKTLPPQNATGGVPVLEVDQPASDSTAVSGPAIVEMNISDKKVVKIDPVDTQTVNPLDSADKASAIGIASAEQSLGGVVPKDAQVKEVEPSLSGDVHLVDNGNGVSAQVDSKGADKNATVHYVLGNQEWMVKVNIGQKKVVEVQHLSQNPKNN